MQRPSNTGGHSGLWDINPGNYGHENAPFGYPLNPPAGPTHYPQGWGQAEQDMQRGPSFSWKSDAHPSQGNNSDQTRSFLGTEQWGRESGGAPWGSTTTHSESTASASSAVLASRSSEQGSSMFPHDSWLAAGSRTSPAFHTETKVGSQENSHSHSPAEETADNEAGTEKTSGGSSTKSASGGNSPLVEKKASPGDAQVSGAESAQRSGDSVEGTDDKDKSPPISGDTSQTAATTAEPEAPKEASAQLAAAESTAPTASQPETSTDTPVSGTIDQLQQLSLMDPYVAQQAIASQLTGYQLAAMQQHYALAAQQQLAPGMFLSSPYIIPAQHGVPTGYDPSSGAPFPMMAQYAPYAGWSPYPAMIQQQMAAASVSASSQQQGSSPVAGQANRASAEMPQSRSQSPASQQAREGGPPQSEILANMAAMQQTNFTNAMAMAGYPVIPAAYYDQTGALIINNGRPGGPVRLYAPGPVFFNGSQPLVAPQLTAAGGSMYRFNQAQAAQQHVTANLYANQQSMSGGSTPVPSMSQGVNLAAAQSAGNFGSSSNINNLGISGIGSASSTPQRRDSFSDYHKHQPGGVSQYGGAAFSQFYNSFSGISPSSGIGLSAMSPSPGPLSSVMSHSHHSLNSPPSSMSSPSSGLMLGSTSRMFSAAPGAETKYRNGSYMSSGIFGSSGSSLFPPTRIRPSGKDLMMPHGRSKLLDDFRNNRLPNPQLHELVNHIVEFSQDQHGSRFIQQKLERATPQEKQHVFSEIIGSAYQLMTDVFGNYVIQKFFEFGTPDHKLALAGRIRGHVLPLALQMYGCRVIQKALECIPQEQQVEIVKELNGHLLKCVKDQNGNHVVQKCIECVPSVHLQFIVDGFKGQVVGLSSHTYGCRVVQRILEHCTDEQTAPILEELHQHTEMLVKDQYGNYVIQHILEHGKPENKSQIVNELRGKILTLSQHKFASNVIEKCVSNSSPQNRAWLIDEVCQEPDALFIMMKDQFANYVVQKMLDVAEPTQKKMLIQKIRPHMLALRKFTYGKHILTKLEKFFLKSGQNQGGVGPGTSAADLAGSQLAPANWVIDSGE